MGEAAVMGESIDRAFECADDIQIRRFGRQGHSRGGESSLAVESGAGEAGSGQEMGEGFQVEFCNTDIAGIVSGWGCSGSRGRAAIYGRVASGKDGL